ncbi:MBL fold metallo-hydrolase [Lactococcus petauri]|uniref:MBL fold metallo-hydrolase n=1 Tax=Lactococcus petauri TaxID=1940789 RepID=UPI0013FDA82B|nr:MBL fold metallo-hydrolase [Lactococcus petauri]NHI77751.1 MBL fold metallo-hydrolase [Lactococcus petauri]
MKLTALGVWGGYPTRDAGTTSYLLQSEEGFNLLLDAGSRAVTELEHELSPNDLDAIILSHYHEDHIADLGALRQYRQLQTVKPEILPIYGHQENAYEFSKLSLENVSDGIAYDVENGTSVGPFDIQFLKTVHPVICYAMRIVERATGQVLIYTGDTGYFAELVDFSKDADILLADVYFFKDKAKMPNHLSSVEAGEIAAQANVKKLILTHLPQVGDLQVLREEVQEAAGNIPVDLAQPHMKWTV